MSLSESIARQYPEAAALAESLGLQPHPEGGWYKETWRCDETFARKNGTVRSAGTAIYYLIVGSAPTAWHRVASDEIWHFYGGDTLRLELRDESGEVSEHLLGPALQSGATPQFIIPAGVWQRAVCTGVWTLVGCTVSPGFDFEDFEME